jgi:hypothetical protein
VRQVRPGDAAKAHVVFAEIAAPDAVGVSALVTHACPSAGTTQARSTQAERMSTAEPPVGSFGADRPVLPQAGGDVQAYAVGAEQMRAIRAAFPAEVSQCAQ